MSNFLFSHFFFSRQVKPSMYRFYSYLLTAECAMCFLLVLISFLPRVARNPIKHIVSKLDMPYGGQVVLLLLFFGLISML